jgi:hypothetical protein
MAARKKGTRGISRIDSPTSGVGWYARVTFQGRTHSKYFADGVHGGTEQALRKAVRWRNSKEKEVGKLPGVRLIPTLPASSQTGVKGVYRSKNSYVVAWSPKKGKLVREFISIREFGEEGALDRAVKLRRKREKEAYGRVVTPSNVKAKPVPVEGEGPQEARPQVSTA